MQKRCLWMIAACLLLMVMAVSSGLAKELTGREIIERSRGLDSVPSVEADIEMTIINARQQQRVRSLTMRSLTAQDNLKYSLMRFTAPADVRGTAFLSIQSPDSGSEEWLYLPALGRERRMASNERAGRFMGSDFTVEDISLNLDDYQFSLDGVVPLAGQEAYKVTALPVDDSVPTTSGISARIFYVCTERLVSLRMEVLDESGEITRVLVSEDHIEAADDLWIPQTLIMEDVGQNTKTELRYERIAVDVEFTPNDFSRRQLTRGR